MTLPITKRYKFAVLICLSIQCLAPAIGESQELGEERFRSALIEYFKPFRFFPVIVNAGYGLGDVIDIDGITVLRRGTECFPGLSQPIPVPMSLPEYVQVTDAGMSFGLRLRRLFDADAGLGLERDIRIHFENVTVVTSTLSDLRKRYNRVACPEIARLLDGSSVAKVPGQHPFFVVSAIMYGKHSALVRNEAGGKVQADVAKIVRSVGGAELRIQAKGAGSVSLTSTVTVPIALRPVTVPGEVTLADFDLRGSGGVGIQWKSNDCGTEESCSRSFVDFATLMNRTTVSLTDEERNQ